MVVFQFIGYVIAAAATALIVKEIVKTIGYTIFFKQLNHGR